MGRKPDITPFDKIKLVDLPRAINASNAASVSYTQCYLGAVKGTIPAERSATGGRWLVNKRDIPSIIQAFSLKEKPHGKSQSQDRPKAKSKKDKGHK